ncbi:MAG: nucleotide sugar dehydrogenase [Neomegalonema sp.]|nr:nucleotide sugar dehydrogenase [Neomegalonema sp.]
MDKRVAVLGLGYVGLPLAVAMGRSGRDVVGYDVDARLVTGLRQGRDPNGEVASASLAECGAVFSDDPADLAGSDVFIIAVPTPLGEGNRPDLGPIRSACAAIGPFLRKGALVIVESTVYPGLTDEVCAPALAAASGLEAYTDFALGYSPERVNPGDAEHSLETVVKIVAGQDAPTLERVVALYAPVAKGGLHRASSIRVAEAAKVIENTQRDLNIALVNEFALIFGKLGLDTTEVLEAAGTKWNFLPFKPGLVGGHCIGVDPYYLTHKAETVGHHPEVILAGRRINDGMGRHVAQELVKKMLAAGVALPEARVLVLGLTFKENCADIRNTKVVDIARELESFSVSVDLHDPHADPELARAHYGVELRQDAPEELNGYDAVVLAVAHAEYRELGAEAIRAMGRSGAIFYDLKAVFPRSLSDGRL